MIFVTTGTTLPFDELIEAMDDLVAKGVISEPVVCQIGNSKYIPRNCEYFRFKPSIDHWIKGASLVICHGGTGTVFSIMDVKKHFIAVANPRGVDDHQSQFLSQLGKMGCILWTNNINELTVLIQKVADFKPRPFSAEHLVDDLKRYLGKL
jgi:UDP-N-acetylglucosamine transferase subunit ALG13